MIKDPLNSMNNIGKSTFNFDNIRAEFSRAHDEIERHLQDFIQSSAAAQLVETGSSEQNSEEAKQKTGTQVVWKKRLDILSKILTPLHSQLQAAEGLERDSPSPKALSRVSAQEQAEVKSADDGLAPESHSLE